MYSSTKVTNFMANWRRSHILILPVSCIYDIPTVNRYTTDTKSSLHNCMSLWGKFRSANLLHAMNIFRSSRIWSRRLLTDTGEKFQNWTRVFSTRRWVILVARKRRKKREENSVSTFGRFFKFLTTFYLDYNFTTNFDWSFRINFFGRYWGQLFFNEDHNFSLRYKLWPTFN